MIYANMESTNASYRLIDTLGNRKKHVRHLAILDHYTARTKCNRSIQCFSTADNVSYFYIDGSRYSHPCRTCLPAEYAAMGETKCGVDIMTTKTDKPKYERNIVTM